MQYNAGHLEFANSPKMLSSSLPQNSTVFREFLQKVPKSSNFPIHNFPQNDFYIIWGNPYVWNSHNQPSVTLETFYPPLWQSKIRLTRLGTIPGSSSPFKSGRRYLFRAKADQKIFIQYSTHEVLHTKKGFFQLQNDKFCKKR